MAMNEYSIEPCSQTRVCPKGLKAFVRLHKSLLNDILGSCLIASNALLGEANGTLTVRRNKRTERLFKFSGGNSHRNSFNLHRSAMYRRFFI